MIEKIYQYIMPNGRKELEKISEEVTIGQALETIEEMKNVMDNLKFKVQGLSAIQIGIPHRICYVSWGDFSEFLINPVIKRERGQQEYTEGCLSLGMIPPMKISRSQKVWCEYMNENGEIKEIAEGGRLSNIIQHEIDHMNGQSKILDILIKEGLI